MKRDQGFVQRALRRPHRLLHGCLLAALVLAPACGGGEEEAAPAPVEATPAPAPAPVALEDTRLYHVRLHEDVAVAELPLTSPLDRVLEPLPLGELDAAFLARDGASDEVVALVEGLAAGVGPSGGGVALVEWNLHWGDRSGAARFWGACSLPCSVEDSFVASSAHFPLDPVTAPLPLFAQRPGATSLSLREEGQEGVAISHGGTSLWAGGAAVGDVVGQATSELLWLKADLREVGQQTVAAQRTLRCESVRPRSFPLSEAGAAPPATTRVLPQLLVETASAMPRAVEGVAEIWPWPEADRFEGGFIARPNPADYGLRLDRPEKRVLWTPTLGQAVKGRAEFVTHELMRTGGVKTTVSPFPGGADVLGATPLFEGKVVLASARSGYEEQPRAQEVKTMLLRYEEEIALPERSPEEGPVIIYLSSQATGIVEGSAGFSDHSYVVSSAPGEARSVARVWSRIALGPSSAVRSEAADDLAHFMEARLRSVEPDESLYAPVFADAGEDIIREWKFRVRGPKHEGNPDPGAFLDYIGGQLPAVAADLRRNLALRQVRVSGTAPLLEVPAAGASSEVEITGPRGAYVTQSIPAGSEASSWKLRMTPVTEGVALSWSWAVIPQARWNDLSRTPAGRAELTRGLGPTLGAAVAEAPTTPEPAAPVRRPLPSQRDVVSGRSVPTVTSEAAPTSSRLMAPATSAQLQLDPAAGEGSVVLAVFWGPAASTARFELTPVASQAPENNEGGEGGALGEPETSEAPTASEPETAPPAPGKD